MGRPALFLDRDGVINVDKGYVNRIQDIEIQAGIVDVIKDYRSRDHIVIVVTNQSGIGRGYFTHQQYRACSAEIRRQLADSGAPVDAEYHCPHVRYDNCECRKPRPGMILRAANAWGIDLARSTLIGDRQTDIEAGKAAGVGHLILWRQYMDKRSVKT